MKKVSKFLIAIVCFCVLANSALAASLDVTFSGIVGGDIRTIYSKIHAIDSISGSQRVWVAGESLIINSLNHGDVNVLELDL